MRGHVVQAAVRAHGVVVASPSFDDDRRLLAQAEPLQQQALFAELAVEAFVCAVLPGLALVAQGCCRRFTPGWPG